MGLSEAALTNPAHNPLDLLEEIVDANEWYHDRTSEDELAIEIQGRWCDYRLFFLWDPGHGALHFSCLFDARVEAARRDQIHHLLALVNERLWIGHFDLSSIESTVMFRHTLLLGERGMASPAQIEDFMRFIVDEPDRYYPAFQYVIWGGKSAPEAMAASLIDVVGEA